VEAVSLNSHLQQEIAELAREKAEKKPATAATLRQVTREINACLSMREKPVKTTFREVASLIFNHLPKGDVDQIVKEAEQPKTPPTDADTRIDLTG